MTFDAEGKKLRVFYYGAVGGPGHYLHDDKLRVIHHPRGLDFPVDPFILDGRLLPQTGEQPEGMSELWTNEKWSILTFWDRSEDSRPGSNSSFVIEGRHDFRSTVAIAKHHFPVLFERFKKHGLKLVDTNK